MNEMLTEDGHPTPQFKEMISATVADWIRHDDVMGNKTQFLVMAIQEFDGRKSYWGMIDLKDTPQEDLYVEIERRFYCAYRTIGQNKIHGLGLLDVQAVLARAPLPQPPA